MAQAHSLPYQEGNIYVQRLPMKSQTRDGDPQFLKTWQNGQQGRSPLLALAGCVLLPVSHSATAQLHATN